VSSISVRGLHKGFGAQQVLEGIDLEVAAGSLTAVLGPSGCGKTTLLRLVAGFTEPDAGTITLGGREVAGPGRSVPARRRGVGYVPQEGALFPHLTVAQNVLFGLPRAERRSRARLTELLELVGLDPAVGGRLPHELSGGMQQRTALARALAPSPAVVLLDEPFSSLDAALRESTGRAVARALRTAGATAVLVTHDQSEALSLADQVAVLRGGRLVQAGSPADVYLHPADPGVAAFVGGAALLGGVAAGDVVRCALGVVPVQGEPVHGDARVVVRPEQLALSAGGPGVPARVLEVHYYGHDAAVHLELLGDGTSVTARVAGGAAPPAGAQVRLTVLGPVPVFAS
jgi:iron(III) transport system ATP-binding protein